MFFQILFLSRAALLFVLLSLSPALAQATSPSTLPSSSSLIEIARWISVNFDLPFTSEPPRIEIVPAAQIQRLRYDVLLPGRSQALGGEPATPPQMQREVVAVYEDSSRTIFLPAGWHGSAADQSVLVHEMVHHLQNLAGRKYECGGAREKPAYLAQRKWLAERGLDLETEFQVDMFTIVALSACMS